MPYLVDHFEVVKFFLYSEAQMKRVAVFKDQHD